ncbi:MAG: TauD/TfdA family dioxygenase [Bacteroidetes bacterium]|nr:TauD/TfdA family dioxygenase [Bacteroidota bacterium]
MSGRLDRLLNTVAEDVSASQRVDIYSLPGYPAAPVVITPRTTGLIPAEYIRNNMDLLNEKLRRHGAILFRGFGISTVQQFQELMSGFGSRPLEYRQRSSPRFEVAENVYHSTTYPAEQTIQMHSENSYAPVWPRKILFCCLQPADWQGETPIADNRAVLAGLSASTRQKFLEKGVLYKRNISPRIGLSWQEVFQLSNREDVERECRTLGMNFEWRDNDRLRLSWGNKAIHAHPETGEPVWFNHAFFFNKYALEEEVVSGFSSEEDLAFNTCYGDGTEISREEIEEIRDAYQRGMVLFAWEKGDVLYMDNMLMAHGRRPYSGDRKIVVSMF